ncbi:MAG TPA: ribosomal L7Ae/L30e/S12e/Gadd45 family protein [Syntrophomonadaceae bacterium]|nr:ribosomal L7Ae/L30e/S12e/Gadd45 family protein [Syntrophomonadaceae bacterium]
MNRAYSLIGFAQKAGQISSGTMAARTSLLRKRARVLIMSCDIAENTRESLLTICRKQQVPWVILGSKHELGISVGKAYRVALTVNDRGLADAILNAVRTDSENE